MATMQAVQVPKPGADFELVERDMPEPGPAQVRIRVQACGICHSDVITKDGLMPGMSYPRVPGHEVAGVIDGRGAERSRRRAGHGWPRSPRRAVRQAVWLSRRSGRARGGQRRAREAARSGGVY